MTTNKADELIQPGEVEFTSNHLLGLSLGYDRPIAQTRWSWGFEVQVTGHYGSQDYLEIALPIVARYHPQKPWLDPIESFGFGLGYSHATKVPQIEVETRGGSRRNLIYWFLET